MAFYSYIHFAILNTRVSDYDQERSIRIHHECEHGEDGIEKSLPMITHWHHMACRVMTTVDYKGQIFLSHPHTYDGFFSLHTIKYGFCIFKKRLTEAPVTYNVKTSLVVLRAAVLFLSFPRVGTGYVSIVR